MRHHLTIPALLATLLFAIPLHAQEFNWTNGAGTGEWSNPNNWNLGGDGFPGDGSDVNINGGLGTTLYQSPFTTNPTTLDLAPGAQLDIEGGKIGFPANGPFPYSFQNSGVINVLDTAILEARETARNFSPATINLFPGGTLEVHPNGAWINTSTQNTGNGTITMSDATITGANTSGALLMLTNQSIFGHGDIGDNRIGLSLGPNSIIDADVNNLGLTIDMHNTTGISNAGVMRASGGGFLDFVGPTTIDNTGGVIEALTGSEVLFDTGFNVSGGTLRRIGTGVFDLNGSGVFGNVFLDGPTVLVPNAASLDLDGSINNGGLILTDSTGSFTNVVVPTDATLTGGGTVRLGGTVRFSRILDTVGANGVLTNVDNSIEGQGAVGSNTLHLINQADGVIDANDTTDLGTLTLDPSAVPMINRGLYTASDGGNLLLTAGVFDNDNGVIEPQDDSTIEILNSARVVGGTLRNVGTGTFVSSFGTIEDVTIEGIFNVQNNKAVNLEGAINNLGEIATDSTGSFTSVVVPTDATLTGGGTVTLGGTASFSQILDTVGANGVLTNVDNTIQGKGNIGSNALQVINQVGGTIHANVAGTLIVDMPSSNPTFENEGTLKASNGGTLNFINALENDGRMEGDGVIDSNEPILNQGTIAPGSSIGTLTLGNDTDFAGDSAMEIELGAVSGTPGIDWDQLVIDGDLDLTLADSVAIKVSSLDGNGDPGLLAGFNPSQTYTWAIVAADNVIGFEPSKFFVDTSGFANVFTNLFTIEAVGNQLVLNYGAGSVNQPTNLTVFRGIQIGGTLADVLESDNSRARFNPGFTLNSNEPPVWLILDGMLADSSPEVLAISIEALANTPGLEATVEAFNWQSNAYDVVGTSPESFNSDSTMAIDISSGIADYVQGDGTVRTRVGWRQAGFTLIFPWEIRLDRAIWLTQ